MAWWCVHWQCGDSCSVIIILSWTQRCVPEFLVFVFSAPSLWVSRPVQTVFPGWCLHGWIFSFVFRFSSFSCSSIRVSVGSDCFCSQVSPSVFLEFGFWTLTVTPLPAHAVTQQWCRFKSNISNSSTHTKTKFQCSSSQNVRLRDGEVCEDGGGGGAQHMKSDNLPVMFSFIKSEVGSARDALLNQVWWNFNKRIRPAS